MCSRKCWIVSFFYFFCTFPIGNFLSEGRFWTTTLPHHTPPPIPKLSSITKTRILFVFLPKKVPVFCLYFYKNEPVWRIRHTALSDFSLNPSIRQLLIDVAASHKSSPIFWWNTSWKFSMYAWGKKVEGFFTLCSCGLCDNEEIGGPSGRRNFVPSTDLVKNSEIKLVDLISFLKEENQLHLVYVHA